MLPHPASQEFGALRLSSQARAIYTLLFESRGHPLTMLDIRDELGPVLGLQEQLDRRRRELNRYFTFRKTRDGRETLYELEGAKVTVDEGPAAINERDRAYVLRLGVCAMCGRSPLRHSVVLQVDHKLPQDWGGSNDLENLQPLCEECNRGKKNLFASLAPYKSEMEAALAETSVHRRIGTVLRAFRGEPVRSDIIGMVASTADDVQEDWQKRLRELRVLGWVIETSKKREAGRTWAYYRLVEFQEWPEGDVRGAIRARERLRGY